MIKLSAEEVYDRLINTDKILSIKGQIRFYLGNVDIVVKQKDVIGNIMQEWMEGWLKKNDILYSPNPNTQMPPDIFLDPDNTKHNLLEIKAFNYSASPGFDIADFKSYQREIISKPYMLKTKYLIFGYDMSEDGYVTIKKLWLKNVWEICRTSQQWAINVQYKNGSVNKIRPAVWYSQRKSIKFLPFKTMIDFLSAIEETVFQNPETHAEANDWKRRMEQSYNIEYGERISIPRWNDIKDQYIR